MSRPINYLQTFQCTEDEPKKELNISAQYLQNQLTNNFDTINLDTLVLLLSRQRNLSGSTNRELIFALDYFTPICENQLLEFGAKETSRRVKSEYAYLVAGPASDYVTDEIQPKGSLSYNQIVGAAYVTYSLTTQTNFVLKPGLRYEYTSILARTGGSLAGSQGAFSVPAYGNLLLSMNLSKKIAANTTLKTAYMRRIQRPSVQDLNPNVNTANPYNILIGNPYLKPEIADRFEIGYSSTIYDAGCGTKTG